MKITDVSLSLTIWMILMSGCRFKNLIKPLSLYSGMLINKSGNVMASLLHFRSKQYCRIHSDRRERFLQGKKISERPQVIFPMFHFGPSGFLADLSVSLFILS